MAKEFRFRVPIAESSSCSNMQKARCGQTFQFPCSTTYTPVSIWRLISSCATGNAETIETVINRFEVQWSKSSGIEAKPVQPCPELSMQSERAKECPESGVQVICGHPLSSDVRICAVHMC